MKSDFEVCAKKTLGTTFFDDIRIAYRCHNCHSEELDLQTTPDDHGTNLAALTGFCRPENLKVKVEVVYFNNQNEVRAIITPDISKKELLCRLEMVAKYAHKRIKTKSPMHFLLGNDLERLIVSENFAEIANFLDLNKESSRINSKEFVLSPLYLACYHNKVAVAEWLLYNKADVNDQNWKWNNMTALHCAALGKNRELVELLLKFHASLHQRDKFGHTPFVDYCIKIKLLKKRIF